MYTEQDKQLAKNRVWALVEKFCPKFTHACDIFDDPWGVETLILGESIGFKPFPNAKVMDIGANVGLWSAYCAVNGSNVTTYEADPTTYKYLCRMLKNANLLNRVNPINNAIWDKEATIRFEGNWTPTIHKFRNGSVLVEGMNTNTIKGEVFEVPCISFSSALGDTTWDCIKMDIEGAEYKTILSTSIDKLKQIKYLQIEFHNGWTNKEEYNEVVKKLDEVFNLWGPKNPENTEWAGRYHWVQCTNKNLS